MQAVTNLERHQKDLDALLDRGRLLEFAMQRERVGGQEFDDALKDNAGDKAAEILKSLPTFGTDYQSWYSEAKSLIAQLLPDRLADFVRHYEKPKPRKEITVENYTIEDYLQGLRVAVTRGFEKSLVAGPDAAIPNFQQQLAILKSVKRRFESSLFDIRQLVQADLFDSELDAASELVKHRFARAAGVLAGVVLERHLGQVCDNHKVKITKRLPTIGDLNDALKESNVVDVPTWRFVQHLADIRNLCGHDRKAEPTAEQVGDLIAGVGRITKTIF